MNSMPETTNPSTRINDSIVAAAIKALQPFHPTSAEEAAAMLLFWVRRSEMTEADVLEVGERMFPAGCPAWCTIDHRDDDVRDDLILHTGDDQADGVVRGLLNADKLDIRVARCDCPNEGTVGTPNLAVRIDAELTTWEQAAELARTILDSFGYLAGADRA